MRDRSPLAFALDHGVGPFAMAGAALVVLSSFLRWYSAFTVGLSGWDISFIPLVTGDDSARGLKLGLLLFVAGALVLGPVALRRKEPRLVLAGGVIAAVCVAAALYRFLIDDSGALELAIGFFVGLAGAALILYEALRVNRA